MIILRESITQIADFKDKLKRQYINTYCLPKSILLFCLTITPNLLFAQDQCFENCWSRINSSNAPLFIHSDILRELQGCEAPQFRIETIDGEKLTLNELAGQVVVLNFWFIGCKPCIEEMPVLNNLVEEYKDERVVFIAFSRDSIKDIKNKFLSRFDFKYKIVAATYNISRQYCVVPYPTHMVINQLGKINHAFFGPVSKIENFEQLKSSIDSLLAKQ